MVPKPVKVRSSSRPSCPALPTMRMWGFPGERVDEVSLGISIILRKIRKLESCFSHSNGSGGTRAAREHSRPQGDCPDNPIRERFLMRRVYGHANATTSAGVEVMRPYWMDEFGNASSIHLQGQHAEGRGRGARDPAAPPSIAGARRRWCSTPAARRGTTRPCSVCGWRSLHYYVDRAARAAERVAERGVDVTFVAPRDGADRSRGDSSGRPARDAADQHDAGQQRELRACNPLRRWNILLRRPALS